MFLLFQSLVTYSGSTLPVSTSNSGCHKIAADWAGTQVPIPSADFVKAACLGLGSLPLLATHAYMCLKILS